MNRREFLAGGAGLALGWRMTRKRALGQTTGFPRRKPNIIVIFTDDQGYADLGCQGQLEDVRTPHIDQLATHGVRFTDGYITAPQCSPSRAGLLTGRYQQRFGLDQIPDCPLPEEEVTIADRLKTAGYATGMVGKWHLEPNPLSRAWAETHLDKVETRPNGRVVIPFGRALQYYPQRRGFTDCFKGERHRFWASYDLKGNDLNPDGQWVEDKRYRLDVQSDAAVSFIERNHENPFFLYLAYYAPHTPLEATEADIERFPGNMPERRRYALAAISAVDRGVGRIMDTVRKHELEEDTLIWFTSDNGAPLSLTQPDSPVATEPGGWDGSRNDPMVGEKGMLAEGGIRVPFVACWKGVLPEGRVYSDPIISLDIAATVVALAGLEKPQGLDGVNLVPYLTGATSDSPHAALYWRFWNQAAIRKGKWKYLQAGGTARFLFDLSDPVHEGHNVIQEHPDLAAQLREDLAQWAAALKTPGIPAADLNRPEQRWYAHYFGLET